MYYIISHTHFLPNIGDLAIDFASFKLLNDLNKEYKYITEINYNDTLIKDDDILLIHGGRVFWTIL